MTAGYANGRQGTRMNARNWEERGLREAVLAGDEAAWRVLYDRCFTPLYMHVYFRVGRDVHRTEEVVQECWLVAVKRIRRFDPDRAGFEAWMRGIADKVLRNHWRRRRKREQTEVSLETDAAASPRVSYAEVEAIATALAGLPDAYREVLEAKYAEGRTVVEIAERRSQTSKAIESLLSRARAAFRAAFQAADRVDETR